MPNKLLTLTYIGCQPPRDWKEESAMHLGRGLWMFRLSKRLKVEREKEKI